MQRDPNKSGKNSLEKCENSCDNNKLLLRYTSCLFVFNARFQMS